MRTADLVAVRVEGFARFQFHNGGLLRAAVQHVEAPLQAELCAVKTRFQVAVARGDVLLFELMLRHLLQRQPVAVRFLVNFHHVLVVEQRKLERIQLEHLRKHLLETRLAVGHHFVEEKVGDVPHHECLSGVVRQKFIEQIENRLRVPRGELAGDGRDIDQKIGFQHDGGGDEPPVLVAAAAEQIDRGGKAHHPLQNGDGFVEILVDARHVVAHPYQVAIRAVELRHQFLALPVDVQHDGARHQQFLLPQRVGGHARSGGQPRFDVGGQGRFQEGRDALCQRVQPQVQLLLTTRAALRRAPEAVERVAELVVGVGGLDGVGHARKGAGKVQFAVARDEQQQLLGQFPNRADPLGGGGFGRADFPQLAVEIVRGGGGRWGALHIGGRRYAMGKNYPLPRRSFRLYQLLNLHTPIHIAHPDQIRAPRQVFERQVHLRFSVRVLRLPHDPVRIEYFHDAGNGFGKSHGGHPPGGVGKHLEGGFGVLPHSGQNIVRTRHHIEGAVAGGVWGSEAVVGRVE